MIQTCIGGKVLGAHKLQRMAAPMRLNWRFILPRSGNPFIEVVNSPVKSAAELRNVVLLFKEIN